MSTDTFQRGEYDENMGAQNGTLWQTVMEQSRAIGLLVLLGAAAAAFAYSRQTQAATADTQQTPDLFSLTPPDSIPMTDSSATPPAADNTQALLATIRQFESDNDYGKLYGGTHFTDFSQHPNVRIPFHDPKKPGAGNNNFSTAAGAYQITYPTWITFSAEAGVFDFSPASQDAVALAILKSTGALDALAQGDVPTALNRAATRWASLPGSTSGQHQQSMTIALNAFANNGGIA